MSERTVTKKVIDAATANDNSGYIKVDGLKDLSLVVVYTRSASSTGNLTCYGSPDGDAASPAKYKLGLEPVLTGTRDADGVISYTTSETTEYEIKGVHRWIYLDWSETADGATITVYIKGRQVI